MDIKFYFSLFLRRLPYFMILLALGTAVGLTVARVLPPVFVAQSRLIVESEQIPGNLAASTVQTRANEQLQIIQQRILTRANLLELANRLQIYADMPGQSRSTPNADEIVSDLRNRIRIAVTGAGGGQRTPNPDAIIINVSFSAPNSQLAANVTNEIVTAILDENVRMRTVVAGQTLEFFVQEVERLDRELAIRGGRILEFKTQNSEALPDSLDFRRSRQASQQERLNALERQEATLRDRRARFVEIYERTGQISTTQETLTPEQQQLKTLRDQLAQSLAIYTPQNPRVRMLEQQIASLEQVVETQMANAATASGARAEEAGRLPTPFELQLADIDGQLAFIATEKGQITAELERLAASIEATPGNTIVLEALEREYANIQQQYDQAISNRARAETGDMIEALSKGQRISVIEQAIAPREPTSPNRPMIAAAGVGGGMALGLALIVLLELLNNAIRRPVDLTSKLGITPFATVPYVRTRTESRRRSALILIAMLIVVVGIPAAIWAIDTYYRPLDLAIAQGIRAIGLDGFVEQLRQQFGQ